MRKSPVILLVVGVLLAALVGVSAALAAGLARGVALVLTLLVDEMKMPQAMTPGAILAVSALYLSYKF